MDSDRGLRHRDHAMILARLVGSFIGTGLWLILCLALIGSSAMAEEPACKGADMVEELKQGDPTAYAKLVEAAKATENTEALLWKIERPGLSPSYLFGTVHLTDPRVTEMPPSAGVALSEAKTVLLELDDLSPEVASGAMQHLAHLAMFTDGHRLDGLLAPPEFEIVKATMASIGIPPEAAAMFKPWIVYMTLSVSACERQQAASGRPVLDKKIASIARQNGIPVVGLETADEQFSALAAVPDDQQLQLLRATLKYAHRIDDLMETVLRLYLGRQMGMTWPFQLLLAAKAGIGPEPFEVFRQSIVVKRNFNMRDRALPLLEKGGAFMGVGALHLPGKDGLVSLFKSAGYTVTAVE